MIRVHIYENGSRFVCKGAARMGLHGQKLKQEITLGDLSEHDENRVFANPHDDNLIAELRAKRVR